MSTFAPHLEILPPPQRHIWTELRPAASLGFVLYGGTATALRLGHRSSVDIDFFTERPLDRTALGNAFPFLSTAQVLQDRPDTFTALTAIAGDETSVKLSFFGAIDFGRVGEPKWTEDGVLQVASFDDLLATKLKVLLQRVEAKDHNDAAALLTPAAQRKIELPRARGRQ